MLLVEVYTASGELLGACGASCYSAHRLTVCRCVCRGRNHGLGPTTAAANGDDVRETWAHVDVRVELHPVCSQGVLFRE